MIIFDFGCNNIGDAGVKHIIQVLTAHKYLLIYGLDDEAIIQLNLKHEAAYQEMMKIAVIVKRVVKQLIRADNYSTYDIVAKAQAVSAQDIHNLLQNEERIKQMFEEPKHFHNIFIVSDGDSSTPNIEDHGSHCYIQHKLIRW